MDRIFVVILVLQAVLIACLLGGTMYLVGTLVAHFDLNLAAHNLGEAVAAFKQAAGK